MGMAVIDLGLLDPRLRDKHFILDSLLEYSPAVVAVKDTKGRYLVVPEVYCELFQLSEQQVLGKTDQEVFDKATADAFCAADQKVIELGEAITVEETAPSHGELKHFLSVKFPIRDEQGKIFAVGLVATDISLRKEMERRLQETQKELGETNDELRSAMERLESMAVIDQLTGAWNRYKFEEVTGKELGRFQRYKTSLSMVMIDIDNFKQVNDRMGHDVGDHVLQSFTQLIQSSIREVDYLFRWGGDEFILLMPSTAQAVAGTVAEKLRLFVSDSELARQYDISASFSVSTLHKGEALQDWLVRTDRGLYAAKNKGKDSISFVD
jgi:diguanylate cyclase (GGDEF)-like protein/PAS domain S-box-containing protein